MNERIISRVLSVFITVTLLTALLPTGLITVSAATVSSGKCGDNLTWTLDDYGNLTISGTGEMYDFNTKYQNGKYVTDAPWGADIVSLTISAGVTSVGKNAFSGCSKLTRVNITDIASWCSVSFGFDAVNPLYYAHNLYLSGELVTNLAIPEGTTIISDSVFRYCTSLVSVTIPESVAKIGEKAFSDCVNLVDIRIHAKTASIGRNAFYATGYFNEKANWEDDILYLDGYAIVALTGISEASIKEGTTNIACGAFDSCKKLVNITIPNTVTNIGDNAFSYCTSLTSIIIPDSVTNIGNSVFTECTSLHEVMISNSVTSISTFAFNCCTSLTSVTIPDGVKSIGWGAFYGCTGLTSVAIPETVTSIDGAVFTDCVRLASLYLPNSVTSIGDGFIYYDENYLICPLDITLFVYEGSYSYSFAKSKGLRFELIRLAGISISNLPDKLIYFESNPLDVTGGFITAYFENGSSYEIAMENDMISGFDNTRIGVQTLTVTYEGQTATFDVTVVSKSLTGIAVTTAPYKTSYLEGKDNLSVEGGRVTLYYNNDTYEVIDLTVDMVTGFNNTKVGQQTLTVTYNGETTFFNVEIVPRSVSSIAFAALPVKLSYLVDKEWLDITGGALTIYFDNDTTCEAYMVYIDGQMNLMFADDFSVAPFTVNGFDSRNIGVCTVTVMYQGCSTTFDVEIVDRELSGISVAKSPKKTVYETGETLDLTGGRLMLSYNNDTYQYANLITVAGVTRMVIEGESASREVSVSGFDSHCGGVKTVVIVYEGFEAVFEVTVNGSAAVIKGDTDGDGEITVADALSALRVAAKLAEPTPELIACCDTDGDGEITVADALAILRVAAKLVDSL